MKIGFIGLGNVGGKLANNLIKSRYKIIVRDLDAKLSKKFKKKGAVIASSPKELAENSDIVITCLPSPKACSKVMTAKNGVLEGLSKNKIWLEMSTTDQSEVKRIGIMVKKKGSHALDVPVSGGCHRAATGNISIFAGGNKKIFKKVLPVLKCMGRKILYTGELGTASILKVITNYLASVHLAALGEAWTVAKKSKLNLNKVYKGIAASSGNSFVHETESQVILNGSYNINFTMDLVKKDMKLFNDLSKKLKTPLEISPFVLNIFNKAQKQYGSRAWSSMVVKRLEDKYKLKFRAPGFPKELKDFEIQKKGYEI
tara:strand:- start:273 stop:1214 length:942 start_codon:yes stop_codon:yes gene_type:complete